MNNPLFAGNPQLQEQFRSQLPIFLQQVRLVVLADRDQLVALSRFPSGRADGPTPLLLFFLLPSVFSFRCRPTVSGAGVQLAPGVALCLLFFFCMHI